MERTLHISSWIQGIMPTEIKLGQSRIMQVSQEEQRLSCCSM